MTVAFAASKRRDRSCQPGKPRWGSLVLLAWLLSSLLSGPAFADEFDDLRARWRETLTLGTNFNPAHPDYAGWIATITNTAQTYWNTMRPPSGRTSLWSDLNSFAVTTNSTDIPATYQRLRTMALAHEVQGSSLAGNPALLAAILDGLDWMNASVYNSAAVEYDNWFDWQIATPLALNDIAVLLFEHLSGAQLNNYMNAVDRFTPIPDLTGANKVWKCSVVALRGIVVKQGAKIESARQALSDVFPYVSTGEGFHPDGSFVFHEVYAYNGHYGAELIATLGPLMKLLSGSSWQITDPESDNIFQWVHDSLEPFIYRGGLMQMVSGRVYTRTGNDHLDAHPVLTAILNLIDLAPPPQAEAYAAMLKEWLLSDTYVDFIQTQPPPFNIWARQIRDDPSIPRRGDLVRHFQFPAMDRVVHARPGWTFGLSMSSARIGNYETTRGENLRGWYTGDGMTYLYNNDLAHYGDHFWSTVDPYRLPGTTVDTHPRSNGSGQETPNSTWVGGAEIDGFYGVSGMQLNAWSSTLSARKSWFMFDDEIVCLGSRIVSTDGRTIETIVENRRLSGAANNAFTVNGTVKPANVGWAEMLANVSWAHLGGSAQNADIGYYFPEPADVRAVREARSGRFSDINTTYGNSSSITRNYLTLWIDHGVNPTSGAYGYVLLPNRDATETAAYAQTPDVVVLQNSTSVQAVEETGLGIVAANFWADGTNRAGGITVNRKASVIVRDDGTYLDVGISDPTQTNTGIINLEITNAAIATVFVEPGLTVLTLSPSIKLAMDAFASGGYTRHARFFVGPLRTNTLSPVADAHVQNGAAANSNFGSNSKIAVKSSGSSNSRESFLKFDLSGAPGILSSASLRLMPVNVESPTNHALAFVPDNSWTESGITWNNKPPSDAEFTRWLVPALGAPITVPVTQLARQAGPNAHLSLRIYGTGTPFIEYGSKENNVSANRPELLVTAGQAPPAVTITAPAAGGVYDAPANVILAAVVSDPDSAIASVSFHVNGAAIAEQASAPYSVQLTNIDAGNYTVTTVATDVGGLATTSAPVSFSVHVPHPNGVGSGLLGEYFVTTNLAGGGFRRIDPVVNFDWGLESPTGSIPADRFSARWTGRVQARKSGLHLFHTVSDEGVRVLVNGFSLINNWSRHTASENIGQITLLAGQYYDICVEFFEVSGPALMQLYWTEPGGVREVIPQTQLYAAGTGLLGTYFPTTSPTTSPVFTRVDETVNFNWGNGSPDPSILPGSFSVRWSGKVRADQTGTHTFHTISDDGVRLWIGQPQQLIINNWSEHTATENSGSVNLVAGQLYDITMDYFDASSVATAVLMWTPPGGTRHVIPRNNLTPFQNNRPPAMNRLTNLVVTRGRTVTTTASGADPDGQSVVFSLDNDAPGGASINPLTGAFSWTPGPEHALGDHRIGIRVVDNGAPPMSDGQTLIVTVTDRATAPVVLVPSGGHWRYLDDGTDQGTAWQSNAFNDGSWSIGPAPLGYGTGMEATTVSYGPNPDAKYTTTYFRREVFVPAVADVHSLNLRVLRNDGVIVYVNGTEVLRDNMPSGTIIYTRPAQRAITGIDETNWISAAIDRSVLRDGANVIAAEIHQQAANGPDIAFDLELSGEATVPSEAPLSVVTSGGQATLSWPADGVFLRLYTTTDLTPPITWVPLNITPTVSGSVCTVVLPLTTNQTQFFRLQTE